ncbi:hypothetical protein D1O90_005075 [Escherichia coli]|nr:hypothetical protein [Escherichia coli]
MQVIAALLASIFGNAIAAIAAKFGAKIAINLAVIAAWIAAVGVFTAAMTAGASAVIQTAPAALIDSISWLPSNTGQCIGAVLAADLAAFVYRQVVTMVNVKSRV